MSVALLAAACATSPPPAASEGTVRAEILPQPDGSAWWMRLRYRVDGASIRGIPVSQFDPAWCAAGELTREAFPDQARTQDRWSLEGGGTRAATRFQLEGEFGSGQRLAVLLGSYDDCQHPPGLFLAVLAPGRGASPGRVIQVETFRPGGGFLYLVPDWSTDGFRAITCFACDDPGRLWLWDPPTRRFQAQPYEEESVL